MILQKLPTFLKKNSAKLLIKYDGERAVKKYTIKLLYSDAKRKSLGNDTDSPCDTLKEIFVGNSFFETDEILKYFTNTISHGVDILKGKFGNESVISVILAEMDDGILYTLHIQTTKGFRHLSDTNYEQACEMLLIEDI